MKDIKNIIAILIVSVSVSAGAVSAYAQNVKVTAGAVEVMNLDVVRQNDTINLTMDMDISGMSLKGNNTAVLIPVLSNQEQGVEMELPAIELMGRRAWLYNLRNDIKSVTEEAYEVSRFPRKSERKSPVIIGYSISLPYERWMNGSTVILREGDCGCDNELAVVDSTLLERIYYPVYVPVYVLPYMEPAPEPVKVRRKEFSAYINFKVDRHEILENFRDNSRELASILESIHVISDDRDISVRTISITGWTSPDGSVSHNQALSSRRANSLADYVASKTGIVRDSIITSGNGEDWAGLDTIVSSSAEYPEAVLAVIRDTSLDYDARDRKLAGMEGGVYRRLLDEVYPLLRRSDYVITYNVRSFDLKEATGLVETAPDKLSVGEIYKVADSYSSDSVARSRILLIAARTYPADTAAVINAAALLIDNGDYEEALRLLDSSPEAGAPSMLNAKGVAMVKAGRLEDARHVWTRAAAAGSKEAEHNLAELEKHLKSLE